MNDVYSHRIASENNLPLSSVQATLKLLAEGATVPFIARYRKEATGTLDEVAIALIRDRSQQLADLDARRTSMIKGLEERNQLTPELQAALDAAESITRLEDIYAPYKPKRRTRAMIARERGLEPLAIFLLENQTATTAQITTQTNSLIDPEKEVESADKALAGARDIIAEIISDDADTRTELRELFEKEGILKSEVIPTKETEGAKFRDYFDWSEPIAKIPSHRLLAIRRGSEEGFLYFEIRPPAERAVSLIQKRFVSAAGDAANEVAKAAEDAYGRLLGPSMETEVRVASKNAADEAAIKVFADNLRELLLASPLGQMPILGIDPGFRTGCKVVCLDAQGKLLHDTVIYPTLGGSRVDEAAHTVRKLLQHYEIKAIAIGNGTASRETESFVRALGLSKEIIIVVVSESGASIYSASDVAREEFPDKDITVRGAVSIARRLLDPLAELVKIDPKSIGVGQYQHDVNQRKLKAGLDDTVASCVNHVGVELNTASKELLSYVSGLNPRLAGEIVNYRQANGPFTSRSELKKVAGLGPKAFEQSAGFLRIRNAKNPLDQSAVHPERYKLIEQIAKDIGCSLDELLKIPANQAKVNPTQYVSDDVGLPTLTDILNELAKPGRDPRAKFEAFAFSDEAHSMEDLKVGQKLPGIVTNVAAFGAFIDIGVHQDGLAHISQLADQFVKNPSDHVKVGQPVKVTVVEIDLARKRIGLSLKTNPDFPGQTKTERNQPNGPRSSNRNQNQSRGSNQRPKNDSFGGNWFDSALKKKQ